MKKNMLTAAAKRLTRKKEERTVVKSPGDDWQNEAWDMYDLVGELRFIAGNLAGQGAKAHLYVGKKDGTEDRPARVEDDEIIAVLDALNGPATTLSQMINRLMLNLFVAGEGWLVGVPKEEEYMLPGRHLTIGGPEFYEWHMMSVSEVKTKAHSGEIELTIEGEPRTYDENDVFLVRAWNPHPRHWWQADSPVRSSMPVLRELVGLTMHVYAQVESRLAGAGLLVIPQSAQRALQVAAGMDANEESDRDEFTEALIEAMLTPVTDRSAASALVPLTITVPDESVGLFQHLNFSTPLDSEARSLRDEAIRRLALGLDAPPELLLGTGSMNHWGGWLVQEETVSSHIVPPLQLICEALTTQYLWTHLEEMGYEDYEDYVVWYDVDHLVVRPNLSSDAFSLHEKGVITDETLRRVNGFDDTDAPELPEDLTTLTVIRMVEKNPALLTNPGTEVLLEHMRHLIEGTELNPDLVPPEVPEEEPTDEEEDEEPTDEVEEPPVEEGDEEIEPPSPLIPTTSGDPAELPSG